MSMKEHENVEVESLRVFVLTPRSRRFRIPSRKVLGAAAATQDGHKASFMLGSVNS